LRQLCHFRAKSTLNNGEREFAWVTNVYYETLGLKPITGRLLTKNDDGPDAPLVAVITDGYWERRFAHDPKVIGESLRIEGTAVTIVGVAPVELTSSSQRTSPGVGRLRLYRHQFVTELGGLLSDSCFAVDPLFLLLFQ
jgi:hypothetical protein